MNLEEITKLPVLSCIFPGSRMYLLLCTSNAVITGVFKQKWLLGIEIRVPHICVARILWIELFSNS